MHLKFCILFEIKINLKVYERHFIFNLFHIMDDLEDSPRNANYFSAARNPFSPNLEDDTNLRISLFSPGKASTNLDIATTNSKPVNRNWRHFSFEAENVETFMDEEEQKPVCSQKQNISPFSLPAFISINNDPPPSTQSFLKNNTSSIENLDDQKIPESPTVGPLLYKVTLENPDLYGKVYSSQEISTDTENKRVPATSLTLKRFNSLAHFKTLNQTSTDQTKLYKKRSLKRTKIHKDKNAKRRSDLLAALRLKKPKKRKNSNILTNSCNCTNSKCLKLYCGCFKNNNRCGNECSCVGCENDEEHFPSNDEHKKQLLTELNIKRSKRLYNDSNAHTGETVKVRIFSENYSVLGCRCQKSNCSKKYCECFSNNAFCSKSCECRNCLNFKQISTSVKKENIIL